MDKIDDILERLKGLQPRLSHPEEMVERVMDKLPPQENVKTECRPSLVKKYWRWVAVGLLFLGAGSVWLLYQPKDNHVKTIVQATKSMKADSQSESSVQGDMDSLIQVSDEQQVAGLRVSADEHGKERHGTVDLLIHLDENVIDIGSVIESEADDSRCVTGFTSKVEKENFDEQGLRSGS